MMYYGMFSSKFKVERHMPIHELDDFCKNVNKYKIKKRHDFYIKLLLNSLIYFFKK